MAKQNKQYNPEVSAFLDTLKHPLRAEIEALRTCILNANTGLTEDIKWNGPNYSLNGNDRITMRVQPPKQVQLIFHRGAKKLAQPKTKLIASTSKLLDWKENDRAVISFKTLKDIEAADKELSTIVKQWLEAAK